MENQMFTIGDFAKQARITVRTLRFYEEVGLLIPEQQNRSGHRFYGLRELGKLQQIQALKYLGYSLQEIKELVSADGDASTQLAASLPMQHKLLKEKRLEIDRAIEAVEHVQYLLEHKKTVSWPVLSSLLFSMEHEEDMKEWAKEYMSEEMAEKYLSIPKETERQMYFDMIDWSGRLKEVMQRGVAPDSKEAFELLMELTEMATKHVEDKEAFAEELEQAQEMMSQEMVDFKFPTFLSPDEEKYLMSIGKAMEALADE